MQPTLIFEPAASVPSQNSFEVSQAKVGFVAGNQPHFSEETAALLRSRLSAAARVISVVLAVAFIGNLVNGITSLGWLRGLIVIITIGSAVLLRYLPKLKLFQLRLLELVVFGSVAVQLSLMLVSRISAFAAQQDAVSLSSLFQQSLMAWCVLIFVYGTLMPNTWKRGAVIMLSAAILPYLLVAIQRWVSPDVALLLAYDKSGSPIPLPLVTAVVAIFAAHVINSARREVFKARQFGQYRLGQRLGAGGMGEVYAAEHMLLKRPCAIKLIKATSEGDTIAITRFEKEVKATAKLTHWNTIEIYDYGRTEDGTFYYVMELLPGLSLEDLVEKYGPLPPERVIYLLSQICGALKEAHSVGLIHRDIKPANIFASQRGGIFDVAKLLDFGLVKESDDQPEVGTRSGAFSGTPLFMSPEQASAYAEVDERADIYSLGAVAYYLLTGMPPFTSKNVLELLAAHRNLEVAPPSRLNPCLPFDVEQTILRCMAKDPSDRFQDADELKNALEQCSCANRWDSDQAEVWWKAMSARPPVVRLEQPAAVPTSDYELPQP